MIYFDVETRKSVRGKTERMRLKCAWACYVERRGSARAPTESLRYFASANVL